MIDENKINERIKVLDSDIAKVQKDMQTIEQKKAETTALLNALLGAKQQCESFLQEFNDDEPDTNSDSGDVEYISTVTFPTQLSDGFILGRSD